MKFLEKFQKGTNNQIYLDIGVSECSKHSIKLNTIITKLFSDVLKNAASEILVIVIKQRKNEDPFNSVLNKVNYQITKKWSICPEKTFIK
jgi:hypothetical protein